MCFNCFEHLASGSLLVLMYEPVSLVTLHNFHIRFILWMLVCVENAWFLWVGAGKLDLCEIFLSVLVLSRNYLRSNQLLKRAFPPVGFSYCSWVFVFLLTQSQIIGLWLFCRMSLKNGQHCHG